MGLTTEGPSQEVLITKGKEGLEAEAREGDTPEGPRMSDMVSLKYTHGWHFANFHFTSSCSGLRPGRIPEDSTTKAKLENTSSL